MINKLLALCAHSHIVTVDDVVRCAALFSARAFFFFCFFYLGGGPGLFVGKRSWMRGFAAGNTMLMT